MTGDRLKFNPPPGWPKPPEGWRPPAGWEPDPSWPEPPAGWVLWVPEEPTVGHCDEASSGKSEMTTLAQSDGSASVGVEEASLRLSLLEADSPLRQQMLRSLTMTLANQGHWAEAIALIPPTNPVVNFERNSKSRVSMVSLERW